MNGNKIDDIFDNVYISYTLANVLESVWNNSSVFFEKQVARVVESTPEYKDWETVAAPLLSFLLASSTALRLFSSDLSPCYLDTLSNDDDIQEMK